MEGYIFYLSDMISMLVRGIYLSVLVYLIVYYGFIKEELQKFHYGFVSCCVGLLISVSVNTVFILTQLSETFYASYLLPLCDMLVVPLFVLFGYQLIRQPKRWQQYFWKFIALEVPYLFGIFVFLSQVKGPESEELAILIERTMIGYTVLYCAVCICSAIFYLRWMRKTIPFAYSSTDDRDLSWFRNVLVALPALLTFYLTLNYLMRDTNHDHLHTLYLLLSITIFVILGVNLDTQRPIDMEMLEDVDGPVEVEDESVKALEEKLRVTFEETQAYTRPDITIRYASRIVGTNIHYLSHHLNEHRGMNFNQYINRLRVNLACQLIAEGKMPVGEVYKATGFRSYSTFFYVFKNLTGYSPMDYTGGKTLEELPTAVAEKAESSTENSPMPTLNERERQLCQLIVAGLSNEEICEKMGLNVSSLRVTRSRLRTKLGLDRKESLQKYLERNL